MHIDGQVKAQDNYSDRRLGLTAMDDQPSHGQGPAQLR